ncbi:MAG: DNA polymerase III subunit gamma/tau [Oceanisphaera sp.]|uniref:DNA polymerase III subunit gamma/tau n=1 Tax=Oceanisphaera sp. TaxID=1929979 RepID=UPI003C706929
MNYQVLARKWRPQRFADVVGQQHVLTALINALSQGRLHHAYLFSGTRGVGKTSIARLLAKALNCDKGITSDPCGECASCQEIEQGRFVDLLEIDAASRTKVEDTRELLDNVQYQPARGRFKVYLIDEVHMLSRHSFNALLKTLEEPPPHVKFLLATTDPQKLPITILSRCLQFHLKSLEPEQIDTQLQHILQQEHLPFEAQATAALARAADGSLRDGLSLTDQALAFGNGEVKLALVESMLGNLNRNQLLALIEAILAGDGESLLARVAELASMGPDYDQVHKELIGFWHQLALAQVVAASPQQPYAGELNRLAPLVSSEQIQVFYQICLQGRKDLPFAPDGRSALEMTLLRTLAFRPEAPVASAAAPRIATPAITPPAVTASEIAREAAHPVKKPEPPPVNEASLAADPDEQMAATLEQEQNEILAQAGQLGHIAQPQPQPQPQPEPEPENFDSSDVIQPTLAPAVDARPIAPAPLPVAAPAVDDPAAADVTRIRRLLQTRNRLRSQEPDKNTASSQPVAKPRTKPVAPAPQHHEPEAKTEPVQAAASTEFRQQTDPQRRAVPERPPEKPSVTSGTDELPPLDAYADASWDNDEDDLPPWQTDGAPNRSAPSAPPFQPPVEVTHSAVKPPLSQPVQPRRAAAPTMSAPVAPMAGAQHSSTDPEPLKAASLLSQATDHWARLMAELPLGGLLRQLAMHSSLEVKSELQWQLWLQPEHKHLLNEKSRHDLELVLQHHQAQPVSVQVNIGQQAGQQTPFEIEQDLFQAAIAQAKDEIERDDAVQFLISRFAAVLEYDSIEPMAQ